MFKHDDIAKSFDILTSLSILFILMVQYYFDGRIFSDKNIFRSTLLETLPLHLSKARSYEQN